MKLLIPQCSLELYQTENTIDILTIEEPYTFASVVGDLWQQVTGNDGDCMLSELGASMAISKSADIIFNPFSLDCNNSKVLKVIYQVLEREMDTETIELRGKIQQDLLELMDHIAETEWYPLAYDVNLELPTVFKLCNLKLDFQESALLERVHNYVRIMHQVCGVRLFVFVNLKQYFSNRELDLLYQDFLYENIWVVDFESAFRQVIEHENNVIFDKDFCLIHLD